MELVRVYLPYQAGDMMPGIYLATPSQAEAIMRAGWAIGELLHAFGLLEGVATEDRLQPVYVTKCDEV